MGKFIKSFFNFINESYEDTVKIIFNYKSLLLNYEHYKASSEYEDDMEIMDYNDYIVMIKDTLSGELSKYFSFKYEYYTIRFSYFRR